MVWRLCQTQSERNNKTFFQTESYCVLMSIIADALPRFIPITTQVFEECSLYDQ
jgi:hypothetical protein